MTKERRSAVQYNENQKATYLFCAKFQNVNTPPLTILEWNELILRLKQSNLEPKDLLKMTANEISTILLDSKKQNNIFKKIESRQKLGFSMMELDQLSNQGYKIMFRQNMPKRMKEKIDSKNLPPFFYLLGDTSIFTYLALGVVGSRDASKEEIKETENIGNQAAKEGIIIVSGGARGIDETAVNSCLNNGGKAIVFPSEGLESWIKRKEIRKYINNNQLLLISAQHISARFTGAYAMQRNKYIHTTAHAVLVASAKVHLPGKDNLSGTWSGVMENVNAKWTPIFVKGDSEGVKILLTKDYAKPLDSLEDILAIASPKKTSLFLQQEISKILIDMKNLGLSEKDVKDEILTLLKKIYNNPEEKSLTPASSNNSILSEVDNIITASSEKYVEATDKEEKLNPVQLSLSDLIEQKPHRS